MSYETPKGLERTEPGHRVVDERVDRPYPNWPQHTRKCWVCSCGTLLTGGLRKNGSANSYLSRDWHGHLDAVAQASLVIQVGTIQKPRISERLNVMTVERARAEGFSMSSWQERSHWAGCASRGPKTDPYRNKRVLFAYDDKEDVIAKMMDRLRKAERDGYTVTTLLEATVQESSEDATLRLITLADTALDSHSLHDIEQAKAELDKFFTLLPVIEAKRDAVEDLRHTMLLGRAS